MEGSDQQIHIDPPRPITNARVSAKEFAAKFKSKRECYDFLAIDCNVFLPPYGRSLHSFRLTQSLF